MKYKYVVHREAPTKMRNYGLFDSIEEANAMTVTVVPDPDGTAWSIEKIEVVDMPPALPVAKPDPKYWVMYMVVGSLQRVTYDTRQEAEKFAITVEGLVLHGEFVKVFDHEDRKRALKKEKNRSHPPKSGQASSSKGSHVHGLKHLKDITSDKPEAVPQMRTDMADIPPQT